jgi:hypothetical protein
MIEKKLIEKRGMLKTPRAAAFAGIIFALLFGSSVILIRLSVPSNLTESAWVEANSKIIALALNLVPYAGIAFLWFIGVIRDRFGDLEDRLFSTVFLGSGILFLALTFVGATLAAAMLAISSNDLAGLVKSSTFTYNRAVMYQLLNVYAIRMAGVFMISLGTIWQRTGLMHRAFTIITYAAALVLLLTVNNVSLWITLVFPGWVLAVSVTFLVQNLRKEPETVREV